MFRFQHMHQTDRKRRHQILVSLWKLPSRPKHIGAPNLNPSARYRKQDKKRDITTARNWSAFGKYTTIR